MSRLADDLLASTDVIDRCLVCGSERHDRMRRVYMVELGGAAGSITVRLEYCADDAKCGEEKAMHMAGILGATFIAADLRRHRTSLLDLGIPAEEEE